MKPKRAGYSVCQRFLKSYSLSRLCFILILSAVPPRRSGSMAAPSPPLGRQIIRTDRAPSKLHKEREAEPAPRKLQMQPYTRSPRVTTPLAPPFRPGEYSKWQWVRRNFEWLVCILVLSFYDFPAFTRMVEMRIKTR